VADVRILIFLTGKKNLVVINVRNSDVFIVMYIVVHFVKKNNDDDRANFSINI